MKITSNSDAVVADIGVTVGDPVTADQILVTTELMKMQQQYKAPCAGIVDALYVAVGDVLSEGAPILEIRQTGDHENNESIAEQEQSHAPNQALEELSLRLAQTLDTARPQMVQHRHALGGQTARENIDQLCDPGSFQEYGGLAVAAQRQRHSENELLKRSPADGIITGIGSVDGVSVAILAVDYSVMAGTQGYFHHKKMDRIFEVAERRSLPVILFAEGGGGRPNDTDTIHIHPAGLDVSSFQAYAKLSGKVPRIAIVHGYCFAGNAALAGTSDLIIGTQNSWLGMGGPAMIEGGGLGTSKPTDIGPSQIQLENGVLDLLVENERAAICHAKQILGVLKSASPPIEDLNLIKPKSKLRSIVPNDRKLAYDSKEIVTTILDDNSGLELRRSFGIAISTWIGTVSGQPIAIMANNPLHLGGAIDPDAADKAAHFMQFCNCFQIPILSLIDTPGFMVGAEIEKSAQVRHVSRLFVTAPSLQVPLFSIITRKAYGLGAMAMAGGSLHASDFTVAWPTGEIGAMGLEGAVKLGHRQELEAIQDSAERELKYQALVAELYERGKAINAGTKLEFDAVIDPAYSVRWIISGVNSWTRPDKQNHPFLDSW